MSVTSAWTVKEKVGSVFSGTERSGSAVNFTANAPSAPVVAEPCAMFWLSPRPGGRKYRPHQHQCGNCTTRTTRHFTFAPPMAAPVYAVALPVTATSAPSFAATFGFATSTRNFGRLYSSTLKLVCPFGPPCTCSDICPVTVPPGAVKLPENAP